MIINLTEEQKHILSNCSLGNFYVSAAPGSGKSTLLSYITESLLRDPNNFVLLLTFTNKAAKSIINKCINSDQNRIIGGTFHSLSNLFAKQNNYIFNICDESKKQIIIKKIFNCKKDKDKFNMIFESISLAKSEWPVEDNKYITKYNSELAKYNLVDFDDMIIKFIELSKDWNLPKITHILVDELQDTSSPQLEMLKTLQLKLNCKMIGVSDDDQSIYSFRGAKPENVKKFVEVFKCAIYNMGTNFRSDVNIVESSKRLIENNKDRIAKIIRPNSTNPGLVAVYEANNPINEIDFIVSKCRQNQDKKIAILYRNRTFKNHLEFELKKAKLKYEVNDVLEIADRSAIKSMLCAMKISAMVGDEYDLETASKALKNIGKTTIEGIKKLVTPQLSFNDVLRAKFHDVKQLKRLDSIISIVGYFNANKDKSLDILALSIEKYFNKSFNYQPDMKKFILDITKDYKVSKIDILTLCNDLGLDNKEEHKDENANIELSTIHAYKGLEKDVVIIPWCQMFEDNNPAQDYNIEDERRLFYVGITRAMHKLYLCYSGLLPRFIKELKL